MKIFFSFQTKLNIWFKVRKKLILSLFSNLGSIETIKIGISLVNNTKGFTQKFHSTFLNIEVDRTKTNLSASNFSGSHLTSLSYTLICEQKTKVILTQVQIFKLSSKNSCLVW